ncbi:mitochondrial 18 KDa domain-containing protein [Trichoderma ceciliae]
MGWWGKSSDSKPEQQQQQKQEAQKESVFDPKLPKAEKLPKELQKIIEKADKDESFFYSIKEGRAPDSTESNLRYAAYATRLRTILLSAHRYVAYTSDIGESFRPVAHPGLVRTAYGISWLYILGDVSHEGYRAYWQNQRVLNPQLLLNSHQQRFSGLPEKEARSITPGVVPPLEDWRTVMVQRAIFQSVASMGLPAFTIHSMVKYSGKAMKNVKNTALRTWGPIGLGLVVVPFLPTLFDKPVEDAVEWVFHKGFEQFGGREYVGDSPITGREKLLNKDPKVKED